MIVAADVMLVGRHVPLGDASRWRGDAGTDAAGEGFQPDPFTFWTGSPDFLRQLGPCNGGPGVSLQFGPGERYRVHFFFRECLLPIEWDLTVWSGLHAVFPSSGSTVRVSSTNCSTHTMPVPLLASTSSTFYTHDVRRTISVFLEPLDSNFTSH